MFSPRQVIFKTINFLISFQKKILFYLRVINHTLPGKIAEKGLRGCHCDKQFVMSPLNRALEEIRLLGRIWILLLLRSYGSLLIVNVSR